MVVKMASTVVIIRLFPLMAIMRKWSRQHSTSQPLDHLFRLNKGDQAGMLYLLALDSCRDKPRRTSQCFQWQELLLRMAITTVTLNSVRMQAILRCP